MVVKFLIPMNHLSSQFVLWFAVSNSTRHANIQTGFVILHAINWAASYADSDEARKSSASGKGYSSWPWRSECLNPLDMVVKIRWMHLETLRRFPWSFASLWRCDLYIMLRRRYWWIDTETPWFVNFKGKLGEGHVTVRDHKYTTFRLRMESCQLRLWEVGGEKGSGTNLKEYIAHTVTNLGVMADEADEARWRVHW